MNGLIDLQGRRSTKSAEISRPSGTSSSVGREVHELFLVVPEYVPGPWKPGQTVSVIRDTNKAMVGRYIYRGIANVTGVPQVALDFILDTEKQTGTAPIIAGFALLDPATAMPTQLVISMGSRFSLTNSNCASRSNTTSR